MPGYSTLAWALDEHDAELCHLLAELRAERVVDIYQPAPAYINDRIQEPITRYELELLLRNRERMSYSTFPDLEEGSIATSDESTSGRIDPNRHLCNTVLTKLADTVTVLAAPASIFFTLFVLSFCVFALAGASSEVFRDYSKYAFPAIGGILAGIWVFLLAHFTSMGIPVRNAVWKAFTNVEVPLVVTGLMVVCVQTAFRAAERCEGLVLDCV